MVALNKIQILPEHVANKIAAGEIIERPSAVVKELVENSIDAGAKNIQISFVKGGKFLISVEDDGEGMGKNEAMLALKRHATSKLKVIDDLNSLNTFGFRGEALPSIASVSKFTLVSGTTLNTTATEIIMYGGRIAEIREHSAIVGTKILVENLFYNVPARRKFLKSDAREAYHITNLVKHMSLARDDVKFSLIEDNVRTFSSPDGSGCGDRLNNIFDYHDKFIDFSHSEGNFAVKGTICDPNFANVCKKHITLFVNGRLVKSDFVNAVFCDSVRQYFPNHRGIIACLFFSIDPTFIDVNIHPTKQEVRFKHEMLVKNFICEFCSNIFSVPGPIHTFHPIDTKPAEEEHVDTYSEPNYHFLSSGNFLAGKTVNARACSTYPSAPAKQAINVYKQDDLQSETFDDTSRQHWKPLGVVRKEFALFESKTGIIIFNIKLAVSRIVYESVRDNANGQHSQKLLLPLEVTLSPAEAEDLGIMLPMLEGYGFMIYAIGMNEYKIEAIPEWINFSEVDKVVKNLVAARLHVVRLDDFDTAQIEVIKHLRSGIDIDKYQSTSEIENLKNRLIECKNPILCPLGNAIYFELSFTEIGNHFF